MLIRKFLSSVFLSVFIVQIESPVSAQFPSSDSGQMLPLSAAFNPPVLKGLKVYPNDPLRFDFILDPGEQTLQSIREQGLLKKESEKLVKYFLASLTIPEKDLWVNLSPYEKDRIIPEAFGQTEMGRDLLAQDYVLKQITALLLSPQGENGQKFWQRVYALAQERYGTTDIPINTFNKVWIVPDKVVVYENAKVGAVYITDSRLKVKLETDYLATSNNALPTPPGLSVKSDQGNKLVPDQRENEIAISVLREIVIPVLEQEVNEGRNFSQLRQIYQSLILAAWYKKKMRHSVFSMAYVDRNKTSGVQISDFGEARKIWERYLKTFSQGVSVLVREEEDVLSGLISRKYFAGGAHFQVSSLMKIVESNLVSVPNLVAAEGVLLEVDMAMQPGVRWIDSGISIRSEGWMMSNEDINYLLAGLDGFGEKGGGYLGIGSFHNIDIALEREADLIVILDIDSKVARVTFELLRLVEHSEDFGGLLAAVRKVLVEADPVRFGDGGFESYIKDGYRYRGRTPLLWAIDEQQFRALKTLIASDRVIVAHVDILNVAAMKQIAVLLRLKGTILKWINLSNLETDISLDEAREHQKRLLNLPSILLDAGANEQSQLISSIRPGRLENARQRYGSNLRVLVPAGDVAINNSSSFHFAIRTLKVLKETSFWQFSGKVPAALTLSSPDVHPPVSSAGIIPTTGVSVSQYWGATGGLLLNINSNAPAFSLLTTGYSLTARDSSEAAKGGIDLTEVVMDSDKSDSKTGANILYSTGLSVQAEGSAGFVPVIGSIRVLDAAEFFGEFPNGRP